MKVESVADRPFSPIVRQTLENLMFHAPVQDTTLNVKEEIARMKEFSERLCSNKEATRSFLIKYGYLTPDGKQIGERYR